MSLVGTASGLRSRFAWMLAGNAVYGASQWGILSVIAKLGSTEMLGRYALAISVATPPMMLAHMNLRAVLTTDVARSHTLGDYLAVRYITSLAALAVVALLSTVADSPLVVVLIGLSLTAENISDTYYGPLQRLERMDTIARSMILRGVLSIAAVAATLAFTRDLVSAAAVLFAVRLLILVAYDRRAGSENESHTRTGGGSQWEIFRTAIPLGFVLLLISLTTHIPRYAIEQYLGTADLGIFAAVSSFLAIGYMITNALGQAALPRMSRWYSARDMHRFRRIAAGTVMIGAGVGLLGVVAAVLLGPYVLELLFRPEYAQFNHVLIATMLAGVCLYSGTTLGYVNTSTRAFHPQLPLFAVSALVCATASYVLIGRMGMLGAPVALALAGLVQVAGHLFILRGRLREVRE